jgi:hypothetical protein
MACRIYRIVVNTSVREGLRTSFLEALANKCALLSSVNPGGATAKFGYFCRITEILKLVSPHSSPTMHGA